jgi:RNA polymerase sigma-70 factor (ECF subfamily)
LVHPSGNASISFEELYDTTFEMVWRTLRRLGVAPEQLDDAAQDVFMVVHRRMSEFEGRSSPRTWVVGIAVRVASDYRRSVRRQGERAPLDEGLVDPSPGPADKTARAQGLQLIHRVLPLLEESQREVFVLVELEQLSVPEVAEVLSVKLNTVYSRLRLARKAFNAAIERLLPLEEVRDG